MVFHTKIRYYSSMYMAKDARVALSSHATKLRAESTARFFKTGKGEYSFGDKFIGVTVPDTRKVARQFASLSFGEVDKLLRSKVHEERLLALIILVNQFKRGDERAQQSVYKFYSTHFSAVNNWDLVDTSAPYILGEYMRLHPKERKVLQRLVQSPVLWERRIAVLATLAFIRKGSSAEIFSIAKLLFNDTHDLIHKAVGWMLREVDRCISREELRTFLDEYAGVLPRTALRYALEHFDGREREHYMKKRAQV